ncbi:branched-chain-amino-acid transaminase [Halotia wernerae UHCC 0503]|nr:branched-chain-amino-acid transaminase [Halotia wernerae UHCC 0503]
MNKLDRPSVIWFNGEIVPWNNAVIHVWTELATRGANVFEGIRCYKQDDNSYSLLCVEQHIDRLFNSLKILRISSPYTRNQLILGMNALINALESHSHVYVRPTVYVEQGRYGEGFGEVVNGAYIVAFPTPRAKNVSNGVNCCVSSWLRSSDLSMSPLIKSGAAYQAFKLPIIEALNGGYDEAILLNSNTNVSETTASTIFIVRKGKVFTPPISAGILESITRKNIIDLLEYEFNISVVERDIPRTELYLADEIFLAGTLAELTPVLSIDKVPIGNGVGLLSQAIQKSYFDICEGRKSDCLKWLTPLK